MTARDRILSRLRESAGRAHPASAVERAAAAAQHMQLRPLSPRPQTIGDLVARFRACALSLSTTIADVPRMENVPEAVAAYLNERKLPTQAVCWPSLAGLNWRQHGLQVEVRPANDQDAVGITEVFCAIAETGTLMTLSGAHTPPATSLLPETHIAVLRRAQIVPAMEEAWQLLRELQGANAMPRAVNFISGPSRTSDIEQTLTLGAHGPYRVHIVLVA